MSKPNDCLSDPTPYLLNYIRLILEVQGSVDIVLVVQSVPRLILPHKSMVRHREHFLANN